MKLSMFARPLVAGCSLLCLVTLSADLWAQTFSEQGASVLGGLNVSGRSASLADIDKDGDLDLFFQGGGSTSQKILRNNVIGTGAFTFTDMTSTFLPSPTLQDSWSAAWGDYDGDGKIDVFVGQDNSTNAAGVTLGYDKGDVFKNGILPNGTGSFTNTSTVTGLNDPGFHQNVAWADIDGDKDLDLLIGMEGPAEKHEVYLQNWATHTFIKSGAAVGFQAAEGTKAYGMAIGDTDDDGDLDVYISTCRADNNIRKNFYKNMTKETGTLSFVDIADTNGTQTLKNEYGAEFVDFDNDRDLDLFVVGADGEPSKIYRNNGGNMFTDVDTITGHPLLTDPAGDLNGGRAVDYDNDGDLDLYMHNNAAGTAARKLYRNDGNWQFTDVTVAEGIHSGIEGGYDSTWGDIDLDGDQDLIVPNNIGSVPLLPERAYISNAATNGNHWLYVRLAGATENTTAIGATIYATVNGDTPQEHTLRREANTNAGTFNQSDLPVHFGLGSTSLIDWLRVVWPDGTVQFLHNVAADQYLNLSLANALPGDFNGNGTVDAADYVVWRDNLGSPFTPGDYNLWKANFGRTAGSGSGEFANVPEPTSAGLLFIVAAFGILGRKRRNRR